MQIILREISEKLSALLITICNDNVDHDEDEIKNKIDYHYCYYHCHYHYHYYYYYYYIQYICMRFGTYCNLVTQTFLAVTR